MELTARQLQILQIVQSHAPITGEQIADMLGVSRPTLRSDLAVLVMVGCLEAKPKVGYFQGKAAREHGDASRRLFELKVKDVQSLPVNIRETSAVNDAVVTLFLEDIGSLIVTDEHGYLAGMISRKDLLKVTLGNPAAVSMPVSLVMTRQPNIVTVTPEDSVLDAARKMVQHQVDCLPVVAEASLDSAGCPDSRLVVGRITKTTMTRVLLSLVETKEPEIGGSV